MRRIRSANIVDEKAGAASESSDAGSSLAGVNLGMDRGEDSGEPLSASATLDSSIAPKNCLSEARVKSADTNAPEN